VPTSPLNTLPLPLFFWPSQLTYFALPSLDNVSKPRQDIFFTTAAMDSCEQAKPKHCSHEINYRAMGLLMATNIVQWMIRINDLFMFIVALSVSCPSLLFSGPFFGL
jgi:hypothetical protein